MQKNSENQISIRKNRFNEAECRFDEEQYSCLKIKRNFKSIHDKDNKFTNYEKSCGTDSYAELRKIYKDFKNGVDILNKYFIGDELLSDKKKIERLMNIFYNNTQETIKYYEIVNKVRKYKHKEIPRIQFYIHRCNNELNLILVDIYHLGIPGKKNNKYIDDRIYRKNMNNKTDIQRISHELDN